MLNQNTEFSSCPAEWTNCDSTFIQRIIIGLIYLLSSIIFLFLQISVIIVNSVKIIKFRKNSYLYFMIDNQKLKSMYRIPSFHFPIGFCVLQGFLQSSLLPYNGRDLCGRWPTTGYPWIRQINSDFNSKSFISPKSGGLITIFNNSFNTLMEKVNLYINIFKYIIINIIYIYRLIYLYNIVDAQYSILDPWRFDQFAISRIMATGTCAGFKQASCIFTTKNL